LYIFLIPFQQYFNNISTILRLHPVDVKQGPLICNLYIFPLIWDLLSINELTMMMKIYQSV